LLSFKFQNHVSPLGKSLPSVKLFQVKDALLGQVADKNYPDLIFCFKNFPQRVPDQ
jgi:hypothetical protein